MSHAQPRQLINGMGSTSSCSSAGLPAARRRQRSMVLSFPPLLFSLLHANQLLHAIKLLSGLAHHGQLLTLATTKLSLVVAFELVNVAFAVYLTVSVLSVRVTNGQLADRALVPMGIMVPLWQHLSAWTNPSVLGVRQNWWAMYACTVMPLGTAYGLTPSYAVFQLVTSLLAGTMPCVKCWYHGGSCSTPAAQFLACLLTQSCLTTLANLLAWLMAFSVVRSQARQQAQAALEHSQTLDSVQSRGSSSQPSHALAKQRSSVLSGGGTSSREGLARQSRRSTDYAVGSDIQPRYGAVQQPPSQQQQQKQRQQQQQEQLEQQQQEQQQQVEPITAPHAARHRLSVLLASGSAQAKATVAAQSQGKAGAGHEQAPAQAAPRGSTLPPAPSKAGRETGQLTDQGSSQGTGHGPQLGYIPFESFGVYLFRRLGLAPKIERFDVAMIAMVDRIDDGMLVRLLCLPAGVLSILYALMVRMRMEGFNFDRLTADAFFVCILAWFMLGRDSVTFSLADATEQLRQQVETSLSALAPTGGRSVRELVDSVREQVMNRGGGGGGPRGMPPTSECQDVQVLELLGEGTFGKVHKGMWRGTVVAIKSMVLPSNAGLRRERMAIMEAAISAALSHPNILQTYTYSMQTLKDSSAAQGMASGQAASDAQLASTHGMEVRLVLEYMDKGTLRDALDSGVFISPAGDEVDYEAVLETVAEVAKGMLHLHSLNILHGDLKARNVLLKSSTTDGRGFTTKIADFGLSQKMEELETHISSMFQGTPSHMAPEVFMEGTQSKAADVYAFGITLWEIYTGKRAFADVARALLAHYVAESGKRPVFPDGTPRGYARLAERCWASDPAERPTFREAAAALAQLRQAFRDGEPEEESGMPEEAHSLKLNCQGSVVALSSAAPGRSDDLQAQVSPEVLKALSRWAKSDEWRLVPARPQKRPQTPVQQPGSPLRQPGSPRQRPDLPLQRPNSPLQQSDSPLRRGQVQPGAQGRRSQPIEKVAHGSGLADLQANRMLLLSDTLGDTGRQLAGALDQPQQQGLLSPQGPSATGTQGHSGSSPREPGAAGMSASSYASTRGLNGPSIRRKQSSNNSSFALAPESGDGMVYDGSVGGTGMSGEEMPSGIIVTQPGDGSTWEAS